MRADGMRSGEMDAGGSSGSVVLPEVGDAAPALAGARICLTTMAGNDNHPCHCPLTSGADDTDGSRSKRRGVMCRSHALILAALLAFAVTLASCNKSATTTAGGQSSNLGITSTSLQAINLTAAYPAIPKGLTDQFYATGSYSDGTSAPLGAGLTWTSSDATILAADSKINGLYHALAKGSAKVIVTDPVSQAQGSLSVEVTDAQLSSLSVSPTSNTLAGALPVGLTVQMTATGYFTDGTPVNMTTQVAWQSDNTSIATVDANGVVTGVQDGGPITISASFPAPNGGGELSGTAPVTVSQATLQSVTVTPASATIAAGLATQLTVTGTLDDGSTANLTSSVTSWTPSNPAVNVSPTGAVTTQSVTSDTFVTISAVYDGHTYNTTIEVTPAVVQKVSVSPAPATVTSISGTSVTVIVGQTVQLTAIGTFSDGTTAALASCDPTAASTPCVTWTSTDNSVATVYNGQVTMLSASTAGVAITATYSDPSVKPAVFTVSSADLTLVTVALAGCDPATSTAGCNSAQVAAGQSITLEAIGTYDSYNNGTAILTSCDPTAPSTSCVAWQSDSANVKLNEGTVTGVTASTVPVTITATYGGHSGTFAVTVTPAALTGLTVSPASPTITIVPGVTTQPVQLTASATYSDTSTATLNSSAVQWKTDSPGVAGLSVSFPGQVSGVSAGTATITAAYTDPSGKTATGTALVTVKQLTLTGGLTVSPPSATVVVGQYIQLTASGNYNDGSSAPLASTEVAWQSDSASATVNKLGQVTGVSASTVPVTITASYGGQNGTAQVTVTPSGATLVSIRVSPDEAVMTVGSALQLSAKWTYSDGSTKPLTSGHWSSSNSRKADVSQSGLVTAYQPGEVDITVSDPATGISGSGDIHVRPNPEREGQGGHGDGNGHGDDDH